jgi:hypothetical protein
VGVSVCTQTINLLGDLHGRFGMSFLLISPTSPRFGTKRIASHRRGTCR